MIQKAEERKNIKKIIRAFFNKFNDGWSDLFYSFEWMLQDYPTNIKNMYVFEENGRIIDFIFENKIDGQISISPYFIDDSYKIKELLEIKKYWGSVLIETEYISEIEGIYKCDNHSTFEPEWIYEVEPGNYYTNDESLISFFVEKYEKKYFPKMESVDDVKFKVLTGKQIKGIIKEEYMLPTWKQSCRIPTIIGFTYFMPDESAKKYLVALYNDVIIGVIAFGNYGDEGTVNYHQSVCYIDVAVPYRNSGIAKKLIAELPKYVDKNLPLVLTDESEMGKKCRMIEHFKAVKFPVQVFEYYEHLKYIYERK